jgi:hypothetical protein
LHDGTLARLDGQLELRLKLSGLERSGQGLLMKSLHLLLKLALFQWSQLLGSGLRELRLGLLSSWLGWDQLVGDGHVGHKGWLVVLVGLLDVDGLWFWDLEGGSEGWLGWSWSSHWLSWGWSWGSNWLGWSWGSDWLNWCSWSNNFLLLNLWFWSSNDLLINLLGWSWWSWFLNLLWLNWLWHLLSWLWLFNCFLRLLNQILSLRSFLLLLFLDNF